MLGPFELKEALGAGAMARVWRARHRSQDVDVAVKIMAAELVAKPRYLRGFRDEIQAVARLNHPGVALVLDVGVLDHDLDDVAAGSPYLAMELVEGGTLAKQGQSLGWSGTYHVLCGVLEALAHAHARGIIHRDLKPPNILLDQTGAQPVPKLTDFGIARAYATLPHAGEEDKVTGTPRYMAPEQIEGSWRDQGPWTDLYALGCVAYWMVCAQVPFPGQGLQDTLRMQLYEPAPSLKPRFKVPRGLDAWIHRLLEKRPQARFEHAADALWALRQLNLGPLDAPPPALSPRPELVDVDTLTIEEETRVLDRLAPLMVQAAPTPTSNKPHVVPPMPRDWRLAKPARSIHLVGAGLGLYALRPVPFVGREDARDQLWEALSEVRAEEAPRAIIVRGAPGIGKTRLVAWLAERAAELGAAHVIHARHSPSPGPRDGLCGALARATRTLGLGYEEAHARLLARLSWLNPSSALAEYDAPVLARMVATTTRAGASPRAEDQHAALGRWLGALGQRRPVLLWLDDVQWGPDAVGLAKTLLERASARALIILTAPEEDFEGADDLRALEAHPMCASIALEPLPQDSHTELVNTLLGFEPGVAQAIVERTGGHPLFAVQLAGSMVERGLLRASPSGFALDGPMPEVPDRLHEVWLERCRHALERAGCEVDLVPLEQLAALGLEAELAELRETLSARSSGLPPRYLEALLSAGLLELDEDELEVKFAHPMMRECIEMQARERDVWTRAHLACAEVLATQTSGRALERQGYHWTEASQPELALGPLCDAAWQAIASQDFGRARRILDLRDRALAGAPEATQERLESLHLWAWIWGHTGGTERALSALEQVDRTAEGSLLAESLRLRAKLTRTSSYQDSVALLERGLEVALACGARSAEGRLRFSLGWTQGRAGAFDEALDEMRRAHEIFVEEGDLHWQLQMWGAEGYLLGQAGRREEARAKVEHALDAARQIGTQTEIATLLNILGELERYDEAWEEAHRYYTQYRELSRGMGELHEVCASFNLGLVDLGLARYEAASRTFATFRKNWDLSRGLSLTTHVLMASLVCHAASQDWEAFDRDLEAAAAEIEQAQLSDRDVHWCAERASQLAAIAGHPRRAARAAALGA